MKTKFFCICGDDKVEENKPEDDDNTKKAVKSKCKEYKDLLTDIEKKLQTIQYDYSGYKGNLYDYVEKHYSVLLMPGQLTDPIQLKKITIDKFNIRTRAEDSIDFTHE